MYNLKSTKNKYTLTTILEIIFTILIILLLVFVKQKSISYLEEVQSMSLDLTNLEQDLQTNNLTSYNVPEVQSSLDRLDSSLTKGLFLLKYILPLTIILISLIFYFLIWKIISKTSMKRFILSSILPLLLTLITIYLALNYLAYSYYFSDSNPLNYLVISIILLIIIYYLALVALTNKTIKFNLKLLKKTIIPYVLLLITNLVYLILVFTIFFLTYAKASISIIVISLFILILIINYQRIHFVNSISKLN